MALPLLLRADQPTNPPASKFRTVNPYGLHRQLRPFAVELIGATALLLPLVQGWIRPEEAVDGGDRKPQPVIRINHVVTDAAKTATRGTRQQVRKMSFVASYSMRHKDASSFFA
jgi:hypothetical protein